MLRLYRHRSVTTQALCFELAETLRLHEVERRVLETDFSSSRFNPRVTGAIRVLENAGLVKGGSRGATRTATEEGLAIASLELKYLTRKWLRHNLPRYAERRRAQAQSEARQDLRDKALEYYASGRRLVAETAFTAAPLLLAYAIEMILKAGLYQFQEFWTENDRKLAFKQHDLVKLYQRTRQLGNSGHLDASAPFQDTYIAEEFLEFASDHFSRRYPDLTEDPRPWSFGTTKLAVYDDCICQLDTSLARSLGDPSASLIHAALHDRHPIRERMVTDMFHENDFAYKAAENFIDRDGESEGYLAILRSDPSKHAEFVARTRTRSPILELNLAAWFRYPRDGEPDPDPLVNLSYSLESAGSEYSLARVLAREFGHENVRVIAASLHGGYSIVQIFDRAARKYWMEIHALSDRMNALGVVGATTANWLDCVIAKTRELFAQKRPGLLAPPGQDRPSNG